MSQVSDPILTLRERAAARAAKEARDRNILAAHARLIDVLDSDPLQRDAILAAAWAQIALWQKHKLCSSWYIRKWRQILQMSPAEMRKVVLAEDAAGDGEALRQNSPFQWGSFECS